MQCQQIPQEDLCKHCTNHQYPPSSTQIPLVTLAKLGATKIFKLKADTWLKGWRRNDQGAKNVSAVATRDKKTPKWTKVVCSCGERLTIEHVASCPRQQIHRYNLEQSTGKQLNYFLTKAKQFQPTPPPPSAFTRTRHYSDHSADEFKR